MTYPPRFNNTPNLYIQVDDQTGYWISRSVTVLLALLVVVDQQAYVPLGLRGVELPNEQGKWGLPGGYLDYGETIGEAAIRETYEELGLNLYHLREIYPSMGDLEQPYQISSQPRGLQNVSMRFGLILFADALPELVPQVSVGEVEAARWFSLEEALLMQLAFNHQEVIRHCLESYFQIDPRQGFIFRRGEIANSQR
jgi:8-oxo-dGTP diphosphatase